MKVHTITVVDLGLGHDAGTPIFDALMAQPRCAWHGCRRRATMYSPDDMADYCVEHHMDAFAEAEQMSLDARRIWLDGSREDDRRDAEAEATQALLGIRAALLDWWAVPLLEWLTKRAPR